MHTHWKWLSAKNTVNLKSASFVVITLFTKVRRFDSYTFIQKSPGLHFGERFTLSWKSSKCRSRDSQRLEMVPGSSNRKAWLQGNRSMMFGSCYVTHRLTDLQYWELQWSIRLQADEATLSIEGVLVRPKHTQPVLQAGCTDVWHHGHPVTTSRLSHHSN